MLVSQGVSEECLQKHKSKMSTSVVDEYSDELNEGPRRIRTGCTIGRIINLCIALNFLFVMITALIVSGTLGAVNLAVSDRWR